MRRSSPLVVVYASPVMVYLIDTFFVVKNTKSLEPSGWAIAERVFGMQVPPIVPRPPLAEWLFDRSLSLRQGAALFQTTPETLRRAVLPFADTGLRPPYPALMRRIIAYTDGAIRPDDWYPQPQRQAA